MQMSSSRRDSVDETLMYVWLVCWIVVNIVSLSRLLIHAATSKKMKNQQQLVSRNCESDLLHEHVEPFQCVRCLTLIGHHFRHRTNFGQVLALLDKHICTISHACHIASVNNYCTAFSKDLQTIHAKGNHFKLDLVKSAIKILRDTHHSIVPNIVFFEHLDNIN